MSFPAWLDPLDPAIEGLVPDFVRLRVRFVDQWEEISICDCEVSLELLTNPLELERYLLEVGAKRQGRDASDLRIVRAIASYQI